MRQKAQLKIPCETDIAWFSGLLDGEGYVTIRAKRNRKMIHRDHYAMISITMCHLPTLEKVKSIWGTGTLASVKVYQADYKPEWRWIVLSTSCIKILTLCLPYLVTKRADALLVLTLQKQKALSPCPHGRGYKIPDVDYERRKLLYDLCRAVKREPQLAQNIEKEINDILEKSPKYQLRLRPPSISVDKQS